MNASGFILAFAAWLASHGAALGQVDCNDPFAEHGAGATKACSRRCIGEAMSCTATFFNLDGFEDSLRLLEAYDLVNKGVRVPATGNLPIIAVLGNAACTDSGGVCNPANGANCAFPCLVCTAGTADSQGGLTCPGLPGAGAVRVRQNQYIIQPSDVGSLSDTVQFVFADLCRSGCPNCPTTNLTTEAGSKTSVPDCNDRDDCSIDCCSAGVCSYPSSCVGATCRNVDGNIETFPPVSCDDSDACTTDVCIKDKNAGTDCCSHAPVVCSEKECYAESCDAAFGCLYAPDCREGTECCPDDGNVCTLEGCDQATGQCTTTPVVCPPRDCFTSACDSVLGCVDTPDCRVGTGCCPDDGNVCTLEECDQATGECTATPVVCPPRDCFTVVCDPVLGCTYTADCLAGANCCPDDGQPCTLEFCDEQTRECDQECDTPGITCPPDREFECDAVGEYGDPIVDDDCSVNPTPVCTEEVTPGKLPQESNITRTCTITNDCGNSDDCVQHIAIVDTTPPEVDCGDGQPLQFECEADGQYDYPPPIVTDNCDQSPDVKIHVVTVVNDCTPPPTAGVTPPPKLSVTRTITASDGTSTTATGDGPNVTECVQHIEIIDSTPPVLLGCPSEPIRLCSGQVPEFTPPTCSDICGECTVVCTRSDGQPLDAPVDIHVMITCEAFDECDTASLPCEIGVQFEEDCFVKIPTVSEWGLVVLALLLLIGAKIHFGGRPEMQAA